MREGVRSDRLPLGIAWAGIIGISLWLWLALIKVGIQAHEMIATLLG